MRFFPIFFGSAALSIFGYILLNGMDYGSCDYLASCYELSFRIGEPLFYGAGALATVFLALWITPRAWRAWKMFAIWYLPLAICLFLFSRDPGSGDFLTPYPETVYRWVGGIFVVISLIIIFANAKGQIPQTNKKDGVLMGNRYLQILWYAYIALLLYSAVRFLLAD